ncbi:MAG: hydrogen peroxide-inducible genes activator [Zoogloeaceae bacterium]|jgi:LysR family hydrogen peroxide-inducible transcriptional activator|nr:hydrogen peroxide-inducible genes activator [Zoogloeaceae bacterium]
MTLTELRYIVALARELHFGRAAERCHVSQPTLSVAVKNLEKRLGVLLFERAPGDIRLTQVGKRVCAQAEKVLEEVVRVEELAQVGKNPLSGSLRLGVIYTIAPYLLPQLIRALHGLAPEMHLYLQENYTHRLAEGLKTGEFDALILAAPFEEPGIVTCTLYDEPFMVALPAGHPLAAKAELDETDIDPSQLLILGQGNCFRDQVISACPQFTAPGSLEQAIEGSSLETLRYMVESGTGVAVAPASAALAWPQSDLTVIRPFKPPVPTRRVLLAWRVSFPRPQAMDALRAAVCSAPPSGVRLL